MKTSKFRPLVQFVFFIILLYGAYVGLRFSNFMPMFLCHNGANYSVGCFLLPLHNLQYGLATLSTLSAPATAKYIGVAVPVPDFGHFWIGGPKGAIITFFLVFILFVILFNNIWCGWACPFGTMQDWMSALRRKIGIGRIRLAEGSKKVLGRIRTISVILFVSMPIACLLGLAQQGPIFCNICPARGIMTLFQGSTLNLAIGSPPGPVYSMMTCVLSGITGVLIFFSSRLFCFVCPIIGLAAIFSKFSFLRIKKNPGTCNSCGQCSSKCPMDIKEIALERKPGNVAGDRCIHCYECIAACPREEALVVKLFKWKVFSSSKGGECKEKKGRL